MKHYYLGYSFEIEKENDRYIFTVRNQVGGMCDSGSSPSRDGADRKARRIIKMFSSK